MLNKDSRKYWRAAGQRLTTAGFLLEQGLHLDAVYIAGYVVECSLKALILARTARGARAAMLTRIRRGSMVHNFEILKSILHELKCTMPLAVARSLRQVNTWSTDLRYEVGLLEYRDAQKFMEAVKAIHAWVERSL